MRGGTLLAEPVSTGDGISFATNLLSSYPDVTKKVSPSQSQVFLGEAAAQLLCLPLRR